VPRLTFFYTKQYLKLKPTILLQQMGHENSCPGSFKSSFCGTKVVCRSDETLSLCVLVYISFTLMSTTKFLREKTHIKRLVESLKPVQRRRFKCASLNVRRTPSDGKSSPGLWPGELINKTSAFSCYTV
jgi:hypothetical protein